MATIEHTSMPPALRQGLVISGVDGRGQYVVKDAERSTYFQIGESERFLFSRLDGRSHWDAICVEFEERFGEPLSQDDLGQFLELATQRGLLQDECGGTPREGERPSGEATKSAGLKNRRISAKQTLLNYRVPFFDPDSVLELLAPRTRWIFTRGFVVLSAGLIAVAATIAFNNRRQWISNFPDAISWQMVLLVFALVCLATLLHEFAHGLSCKHFGGEVREIGFLLLLLMPCFYCNVSDAWLFREKWKRLWVGAAGAFCDLWLWAAATIVWRLTVPETSVNYLAWMLGSVCGTRWILNLNPLIKLDGYYLLSDWTEMPNLAERSKRRWMKALRWFLWGGSYPGSDPRGRFLLLYGMASWLFLVTIIVSLILGLRQIWTVGSAGWGAWGAGLSILMIAVIGRNVFSSIFKRELTNMIRNRRRRAILWLLALVGILVGLAIIPFQERATGTFQVRPATRVEINALHAGFIREIEVEEGSQVSPGVKIARIEIPDLDMNITKKLAEIRESEANLRRLQAGPRPEEIVEQRRRVERARAWRDLAEQDLRRAGQAFLEEMQRIERQLDQYETELEYHRKILAHADQLAGEQAISGEQYLSEKTKLDLAALALDEAQAHKRAKEAEGTSVAEMELARREKELADEQSDLTLLEAGGRPEEIEAEQARLARLVEERMYLENQRSRVVLRSPVTGVITTPRMNEKEGQYVATGAVICVVEDLSDFSVEIAIKEEDELKVKSGQVVQLRARAMPLRTFQARVQRKAPASVLPPGQSQGTVTVYCRLDRANAEILSGLTGHAKIYGDHGTLGTALVGRIRKLIRTEFWW